MKIIQHLYQTKYFETNTSRGMVRQLYNKKAQIQKTMKMNEAKIVDLITCPLPKC